MEHVTPNFYLIRSYLIRLSIEIRPISRRRKTRTRLILSFFQSQCHFFAVLPISIVVYGFFDVFWEGHYILTQQVLTLEFQWREWTLSLYLFIGTETKETTYALTEGARCDINQRMKRYFSGTCNISKSMTKDIMSKITEHSGVKSQIYANLTE